MSCLCCLKAPKIFLVVPLLSCLILHLTMYFYGIWCIAFARDMEPILQVCSPSRSHHASKTVICSSLFTCACLDHPGPHLISWASMCCLWTNQCVTQLRLKKHLHTTYLMTSQAGSVLLLYPRRQCDYCVTHFIWPKMLMGSCSPCPQKRTCGLHKSAPNTLHLVQLTNPNPS